MSKIFYTCLLVLVLAVLSCTAEPPRRRQARIQTRLRFLARQEAADAASAAAPTAAPAPYPAAGVTPEIPFDLPTETESPAQPDQTYGPPDETYGPPAVAEEAPDSTYLPPDNTYGPPAAEAAAADGAPVQEVSQDFAFEKLIQPRFKAPSRRHPAALRQHANLVEVIRSEPAIIYTLQ